MPETEGKGDVYGIYLNRQADFTISNCEVQQVNFFSIMDKGTAYGIRCIDINGTNILNANRVHDVFNSGSGGLLNASCGLSIASAETSVSSITNNFIGNIFNNTEAATETVLTSGIRIEGGGDVSIYHNSVYLSYGTFNAQSPSANLDIRRTATSKLYVKNNIFKNYYRSPVAKTYCFYLAGGTLLSAGTNIYDCHSGAPYYTGYYDGTNWETLANWQAAVTLDINSTQFSVPFTSPINLYITGNDIDEANDYNGIYIENSEIIRDIDDKLRVPILVIGLHS